MGENEDRKITSFDVQIQTDSEGNFSGVGFNGKTYSLADWNKMFEQANPHKKYSLLKMPEEWQLKPLEKY